MRTHPYAEAVYRVVPLTDGGYGVEVKIPDSYPTTVSRFATEAAAETWIEQNKKRVSDQSAPRSLFRKAPRKG